MNAIRQQMLQCIREAVTAGNRAGGSPALPERGTVGYQGAGDEVIARFREEFAAAGGHTHVVADRTAATTTVLDLVRTRSVRRLLLGGGEVLAALALAEPLRAAGIDVVEVGTSEDKIDRTTLFQADLGLSGVDYLIAETGSVLVASGAGQPRTLSLLPPIHVAVAERRQILPDLFDLFERFGAADLPACLTLITGPSKTGDIELRLVTGVHGPGEVHVVLIDTSEPEA